MQTISKEETVLELITGLCEMNGECYMGNKTMSRITKLSPSQISTIISKLVMDGIISSKCVARISNRGYSGTTRIIRVTNK